MLLMLFMCALLPGTSFACDTLEEAAAVLKQTNGDQPLALVVCQVIAQGRETGTLSMIPGFSLIGRVQTRQPIAAKKIYLTAGTTYAFAGACDSDCHDLDIKLLDSDLKVVAQDIAPGDTPLVVYTPTYSGYFAVVPILAQCDVRQCAYAVLAYSQ